MSKKIKKILLIIFGLIIVAGAVLGILILVYSKDLPDPASLDSRIVSQSTKIYDRKGTTLLYEIYEGEKRTLVKLEDISPYVIKAALAAEDHRFYEHHGFVLQSMIRAFFKTLQNPKNPQGGSTITQQLARNAFLTLDQTIPRKIKEAILTFQIERNYSKDQIMEMYLNQINFGYNVYGIESASQFYFNKSAKDLSLAEAAYLIAIVNAPGYFSPFGSHRDELEARKNWILDRMVQLNYFSQEEIEAAKQDLVVFAPLKSQFPAPHFVMYVKELLSEQFSDEELAKGGYTIITTLDVDLQKIAEETVQEYGDYNEKHVGARNMALLAEDPKTGQILAMVGSRDYWNIEQEGNVNATLSIRQPGSSFKPIVYSAAFEKGFYPESVVFDTALDGRVANFSTNPSNPYYVRNYDEKTRGPVTLRQALAQSLNIPSVKVLYLVGVDNAIQMAQRFGITTLTEPASHYGLSLVLGGGGVKLIEMVNAYSVFANDGVFNPQSVILEIRDSQGKVISSYQKEEKQIISSQIARMITDILKDNTSRAPAFGWQSQLYFPDYEVAVKTGTDSEYRDAWTLGYTTSLAAGVWAGNNDRSPVAPTGAPASMVAAPAFHKFMEKSFQLYPPSSFEKPLPYSLESVKTPMVNGQYIVEKQYKNKNTNEIKTVKEVHNILYYLNPQDPQFLNWEIPVLLWAQLNLPNFYQEYNQSLSPEYELIQDENALPEYIYFPPTAGIEFLHPKNNESVSEKEIPITIEIPEDPQNPIKQVNLYCNNIWLSEIQKISPNTFFYLLNSDLLKNNEPNEIKVEVIDNLDQKTEAKITIFKAL